MHQVLQVSSLGCTRHDSWISWVGWVDAGIWSGQDPDLCCWSTVSKACGQSINEQLVDQPNIYWISHRPTLGLNIPSRFGRIDAHTQSVNATRRQRASAYHHGIATGPLPIHNCWRQLQQSSQAKDHRRLTLGSLSSKSFISWNALRWGASHVHSTSDFRRVLRGCRTVARWGTKDPSHLAIPRLRRSSVTFVGSGISATADTLDGSAAIPSALNLCPWKMSSFTPRSHLIQLHVIFAQNFLDSGYPRVMIHTV